MTNGAAAENGPAGELQLEVERGLPNIEAQNLKVKNRIRSSSLGSFYCSYLWSINFENHTPIFCFAECAEAARSSCPDREREVPVEGMDAERERGREGSEEGRCFFFPVVVSPNNL